MALYLVNTCPRNARTLSAASDESLHTPLLLVLTFSLTPSFQTTFAPVLILYDLNSKVRMEAKVQGHNIGQLLQWKLSPTYLSGPTPWNQITWLPFSQWVAGQPAVCYGSVLWLTCRLALAVGVIHQTQGLCGHAETSRLHWSDSAASHRVLCSPLLSSGWNKSHIVFFLATVLVSLSLSLYIGLCLRTCSYKGVIHLK